MRCRLCRLVVEDVACTAAHSASSRQRIPYEIPCILYFERAQFLQSRPHEWPENVLAMVVVVIAKVLTDDQ